MSCPKVPLLALPYIRMELPGWGLLYGSPLVRGHRDASWSAAPIKIIRGKLHGFQMELDLSNWSDRLSYFLGRYYELSLQQLLQECIKPGDRVVDVGANLGHVTLLLARLVGEAGSVDSFEPNPDCLRRLRRHLEINDIKTVRVFGVALGDRAGHHELKVADAHTGVGTLGDLEGPCHNVTSRYMIDVCIGDHVLLDNPDPVKLIKIDVEGFECRVLAGLVRTIERDRPIIVTEASQGLLARAGGSLSEMFEVMNTFGYHPRGLGSRRRWLRHRLDLCPLSAHDRVPTPDVLWVHEDDHRLEALLSRTDGEPASL